MKKVKSRKIKNKNVRPAISFDSVKPAISFDNVDEVVKKEKVRKRKVNVKKSNDSLEKEEIRIDRIRRIRGRKLRIYDFSDTFFVEKVSTLQHSTVISNDKEDIDQDEFEHVLENEDNFSIGLIILVLAVCLVVGFIAGYMAYRLIFVS